jgi:hypothetical protein
MSRTLDLIAKEYAKENVTVLRKDISLFANNLQSEMINLSRDIERIAKKNKTGQVVLVTILYE